MRVAIIRNNGNIEVKIERILKANEIKGDFIDKVSKNSINIYDVIIFTYENKIPNLPKVIEQIVLEKKSLVIFVSNNLLVGQFYNVLNDLFFNIVNVQFLDIELPLILRSTEKYISEIYKLNKEVKQLKNKLSTINLVNNAKRILASKGFNEAASHQFIQKKSMDLRLSKKMTAELIIQNKVDF